MGFAMWQGLDQLLELQRLDGQVARLEADARAIPQAIQALETKLQDARAAAEAARAEADQLQKTRRSKERELEEAALNARKKQGRLYEIKTNEEYSAVLKEIEALKQVSSRLETEILELMEVADAAAKTVTEAEKRLEGATGVRDKERAAKEAQLATVQRELAAAMEARKAEASRLPRELLQQYTRLLKSRGVAVVAVVDGSCNGCGIALTPQAGVEVRRNDRMFTCPSCNRILYFPG
jgi:predicted  nucleic acid-binding Zn-ribbon protein